MATKNGTVAYRVLQIMPADGWAVGLFLSSNARASIAEGEETQIESVRREDIFPLVGWAVVNRTVGDKTDTVVDGLIVQDSEVETVHEATNDGDWYSYARFISPG